jgi:hypothetical protein
MPSGVGVFAFVKSNTKKGFTVKVNPFFCCCWEGVNEYQDVKPTQPPRIKQKTHPNPLRLGRELE